MRLNSKTENVIKLKNQKCDKTKNDSMKPNLKTKQKKLAKSFLVIITQTLDY